MLTRSIGKRFGEYLREIIACAVVRNILAVYIEKNAVNSDSLSQNRLDRDFFPVLTRN